MNKKYFLTVKSRVKLFLHRRRKISPKRQEETHAKFYNKLVCKLGLSFSCVHHWKFVEVIQRLPIFMAQMGLGMVPQDPSSEYGKPSPI